MTVELIYDRDCPNVERARANLVKALAVFGREARWSEWDRGALESPRCATNSSSDVSSTLQKET